VTILIVVSAFAVIESYRSSELKKPFYIGVTYCGNSTVEAEQLVDKVQNYTNLFVLQSGPLQENLAATTEICDYAVNHGLDIIMYFGSFQSNRNLVTAFLNATQNRWGEHFLGVYYGDEPAGKMLDANQVDLWDQKNGYTIIKHGGEISFKVNDTDFSFSPSGIIELNTLNVLYSGNQFVMLYSDITTFYPNGTITTSQIPENGTLIYQPNGEVTFQNLNGETLTVTDRGNISQFEPYIDLWNSRPIQTYQDAAKLYVDNQKATTDWLKSQSPVKTFTSDYGLYWFDYQGNYDVVFAQLGPNNNTAQELALVRGAAHTQNKNWGTMITWTNSTSPSLQTSEVMYNNLKQTYEDGATYAVVFNYAPNSNGTGLLQDEHFAALQKFWTDVVQNPKETNNVTAQDALILPNSYGWGMRNPQDTIWGLWNADNSSHQIWTQLQSKLAQYGSRLDIVYDDPAYPVVGKYSQIYYWNQTG
jgi:hypothetical protein